MRRKKRVHFLFGLFIGFLFGIRPCAAQYFANFQTNIISGVLSNWSGDYSVGNTNFGDVLQIQGGGVLAALSGGFGYVGTTIGSSNNSVVVSGAGSIWSNASVVVGVAGAANSLVISNGGMVLDGTSDFSFGYLGQQVSSSNNTALVTDVGSVWSNRDGLLVGTFSAGNSLVISNGGHVLCSTSIVGNFNSSNSNNRVLVTGSNSLWQNDGSIAIGGNGCSLIISNGGTVICGGANSAGTSNSTRVVNGGIWRSIGRFGRIHIGEPTQGGDVGSGNSLVVDGGTVEASNLFVACNNLIELDSGAIAVTNAGATGLLEVHGNLVVNEGVLLADTLVISNSCASLVHTGGTLIVSNVILDPNAFRILSVNRQNNDLLITWLMGPGATNALQVSAGAAGGGFNTNTFSDIFVVTNNATAGTPTNYLDVGAATNVPARYYRARLSL